MQIKNENPVCVRVKKTTLFTCFQREKTDEISAVCLGDDGQIRLRETEENFSLGEMTEENAEGIFSGLAQLYDTLTGAGNAVELTTSGRLFASEKKCILQYEEYTDRQEQKQTVELTVDDQKIAVLVCAVGNELKDFLVFEKGKKHRISTWVDRPVVLHTLEMEYAFCENAGSFTVLYDMEIGGSVVEKDELSIRITPAV